LDREQTEEIAGTLWTESEISAVVDSYFQMLTSERAGVAYSKAQNRRQLMTTVHRSEGLIERKLQNISAVLDMLGTQWINGYKPLTHDQDALVAAVERNVGRALDFLCPASIDIQPLTLNDDAVFVAPPSVADFEKTMTPAGWSESWSQPSAMPGIVNWGKPGRNSSWNSSATGYGALGATTWRMTFAGFPTSVLAHVWATCT
jgi:hypothetical protein